MDTANLKAWQVVDELANKIIQTISPTCLVVGLSGGADSTLALIIAKHVTKLDNRFSVKAVHCIHGLDDDDPIWLAHCQKLCQKLEVPLVTPKLNIVYGPGISREAVSREQRYGALLKNLDNGVLVLGHQADDQVENFLLAFKRGSGPKGLSGMRFLIKDERGTIIRPLLSLHKQQIIEIIEALGFTHVFDISNTYLYFERNFMRLKVLPLLKERFPGIDKSILSSAKLCGYEHDLALRYAKETFDKIFNACNLSLDFTNLNLDDESLVFMIFRLYLNQVTSLPPELTKIKECINLCKISPDQNGEVILGEYTVKRFRNKLYLVKEKKAPNINSIILKQGQPLLLGDYKYELVANIDAVELVFEYSGKDKLKPLSRVHSREIKKLFTEYEIPSWVRTSKCIVKDITSHEVLGFADLFACKNQYDIKTPFIKVE